MENIKKTIEQLSPEQRLSKNEIIRSSETTNVSNENLSESAIIGSLIDKFRLSRGWKPLEGNDHYNTVAAWLDVLYSENVPPVHWVELYKRTIVLRSKYIQEGKEPPQFAPETFVALWNNLKHEIENAMIESKRFLPQTAAAACLRCFGTGFEEMFNGTTKVGVRPGCKHELLTELERKQRKVA